MKNINLQQVFKNFDVNKRVFEDDRDMFLQFAVFTTDTGDVVNFKFDKRGFFIFDGFKGISLTLTLNLVFNVGDEFTIVEDPWNKSISDFPDGDHVILFYDSKRIDTQYEILKVRNNGEYVVVDGQFGFDCKHYMTVVAYLSLPPIYKESE